MLICVKLFHDPRFSLEIEVNKRVVRITYQTCDRKNKQDRQNDHLHHFKNDAVFPFFRKDPGRRCTKESTDDQKDQVLCKPAGKRSISKHISVRSKYGLQIKNSILKRIRSENDPADHHKEKGIQPLLSRQGQDGAVRRSGRSGDMRLCK